MFPASYYHRSYPGNGHSYPFYHQHQLTTNPGPPLIPSRLDASDDVHVTVLQIDQNQQQQLKKNQYWLNNDQNYPRTNINNSNHNKNDGTIYTNLSAEVMNSTKIENFSNLNNNNNNNNFQQFFHSQNDLNLLKQNQNDFDPARDLNSDFVTVLKIASTTGSSMMTTTTTNSINENLSNGGFNAAVSVSAVGGGGGGVGGCHNQTVHVDNKRGEIDEEVTIYRLPGERLGMALRFDGGQSATETIRRVFVQSISMNSPSSKAIGLMLGMLREGDEILQIDGRQSSSLTRLECITLLRDAPRESIE
ncbi:PDZ domain containing protein 3 [Sarcoptes scabiei]|uniref:PDZ domain containing protein 3 n=1 Tax=Sarcoptes scabiei TaxID=52283 RepID=A0A131ZZP9_SARSC|nr:PDZ domain containing protein 3 [Sarcoptes scabiei]